MVSDEWGWPGRWFSGGLGDAVWLGRWTGVWVIAAL